MKMKIALVRGDGECQERHRTAHLLPVVPVRIRTVGASLFGDPKRRWPDIRWAASSLDLAVANISKTA